MFEKKHPNRKNLQEVSAKPWKLLPERVPTTPQCQPIQQPLGKLIQTNGKITREAHIRVGTTSIEENIKWGKLKKYYENWKKYTSYSNTLRIIKEGLKINSAEVPFQSGYKIYFRENLNLVIIFLE